MSFRMPDFRKTQRVIAYMTLATCCVAVGRMLQACSGAPQLSPGDVNRAVVESRDACQRLLEATEPAPATEGQGGSE